MIKFYIFLIVKYLDVFNLYHLTNWYGITKLEGLCLVSYLLKGTEINYLYLINRLIVSQAIRGSQKVLDIQRIIMLVNVYKNWIGSV